MAGLSRDADLNRTKMLQIERMAASRNAAAAFRPTHQGQLMAGCDPVGKKKGAASAWLTDGEAAIELECQIRLLSPR